MLKHFLIALVLAIAYIGLQYDFTKKPKKQKNVFIMGSIIFFVTFVGCWLILPKKKSVKFSNDVHVKTFNKTKALTDGDGFHDEDGSGSSDGGASDESFDGGGGGGGYPVNNYQPSPPSQQFDQSTSQSSPLTSGPPVSLPSLSSSPLLTETTTIPSSSSTSFNMGDVPFPS